jgi:hypothetical protein
MKKIDELSSFYQMPVRHDGARQARGARLARRVSPVPASRAFPASLARLA